MKKIVVIVLMLAVVAGILAASAAYLFQNKKMQELERQVAQAEELYNAKDYDGTLQLLRRADPQGKNLKAKFLEGRALYERGNYQEALRAFDEVAKRAPHSILMPEVLLYRGRYALEIESNPKKARDVFLQLVSAFPDSTAADFALYYLAKMSYDEKDFGRARASLEQILKRTDSPARDEAEFLLGDINMQLLRSPEPGPDDVVYTIKKGDSIWKLERELKVPGDLIVGINNLRPNALTVGMQIKVPKINPSIYIDKARRTLTVRNSGAFLKKYRVGLNRQDSRVPAGEYQIQNKLDKGADYTDPQTGAIIKAGDPANPLGSRFLQLRRDMGIHGTNRPELVGTYTDVGWIMMTDSDLEEIYALVRKGTPVSIKGKNALEASSGNKQ
jgi:tetratricopeptide (TPR) repeat protein